MTGRFSLNPIADGRLRKNSVFHPARSFSPPAARIRELEQALAEATRQSVDTENRYTAILHSKSWRYTQPLRTVLGLQRACGKAIRMTDSRLIRLLTFLRLMSPRVVPLIPLLAVSLLWEVVSKVVLLVQGSAFLR